MVLSTSAQSTTFCQVAFSLLIAAQAAPDNGRILFRHGLSGTHHASHFHESFRRGLAEQQIRGGTRNLLQQGNASALQFISLGKHVGVDMVEIPEGVSYEWVLEELKKHPGNATWESFTQS